MRSLRAIGLLRKASPSTLLLSGDVRMPRARDTLERLTRSRGIGLCSLVLYALGTFGAVHAGEYPPLDECPTSRMSPFLTVPARPKFAKPATPGPASLHT